MTFKDSVMFRLQLSDNCHNYNYVTLVSTDKPDYKATKLYTFLENNSVTDIYSSMKT